MAPATHRGRTGWILVLAASALAAGVALWKAPWRSSSRTARIHRSLSLLSFADALHRNGMAGRWNLRRDIVEVAGRRRVALAGRFGQSLKIPNLPAHDGAVLHFALAAQPAALRQGLRPLFRIRGRRAGGDWIPLFARALDPRENGAPAEVVLPAALRGRIDLEFFLDREPAPPAPPRPREGEAAPAPEDLPGEGALAGFLAPVLHSRGAVIPLSQAPILLEDPLRDLVQTFDPSWVRHGTAEPIAPILDTTIDLPVEETRRWLRCSPDASFTLDVEVPPSTVLDLQMVNLYFDRNPAGKEVTFEVLAGGKTVLEAASPFGQSTAAGDLLEPHLRDGRVDLGAWAGKTISLEFRLHDDSKRGAASDFLGWSRLRLLRLDRIPRLAAGQGGPNVLFLLVDTLRADHVGAYGAARPATPELDRLAAEGTLFEQAIAPSSWTLPSVASIFTGLLPYAHGVLGVNERTFLDRPLVTLAERLQAAGFTTGAFIANPLILRKLGFAQGFEHFATASFVDARPVIEDLVSWLDEVQDLRWFAYVHLIDPHAPYWPPPEDRESFAGPAPTARDFSADLPQLVLDGAMPPPDGAELDHIRDLYDGEIHAFDRALGWLRHALEARGLLDDTILIVTADHGEEFYEHGFLGHGFDLFDETVHVPLILRWPGHIAAARIARQVELVSIHRTLLDLLGLEAPAELAGGDLFSGRRSPFALSMIRGSHMMREKTLENIRSWFALRGEGKKLIVSSNPEDPRALYDLREDPGETVNLAEKDAATAERMESLLQEAIARSLETGRRAAGPPPTDPDVRRALEELGYVSGDS